MDEVIPAQDSPQWFALRDLKRRHAKMPAYKMFEGLKTECFTPMIHRMVVVNGKRMARVEPFIQDLLFVRDTRKHLDSIVESTPQLQYRYKLGAQHTPIIVPAIDMERFKKVVEAVKFPVFYRPEEVLPDMRNRRISIIGGLLDGCEGTLVTVRGSKSRRLLVEIPGQLAASVEVEPEFIRLL